MPHAIVLDDPGRLISHAPDAPAALVPGWASSMALYGLAILTLTSGFNPVATRNVRAARFMTRLNMPNLGVVGH